MWEKQSGRPPGGCGIELCLEDGEGLDAGGTCRPTPQLPPSQDTPLQVHVAWREGQVSPSFQSPSHLTTSPCWGRRPNSEASSWAVASTVQVSAGSSLPDTPVASPSVLKLPQVDRGRGCCPSSTAAPDRRGDWKHLQGRVRSH